MYVAVMATRTRARRTVVRRNALIAAAVALLFGSIHYVTVTRRTFNRNVEKLVAETTVYEPARYRQITIIRSSRSLFGPDSAC